MSERDRGPAENRRPAQGDGDRAGEDVVGVLVGLEPETVLEAARELEGVALVRARDTEAGAALGGWVTGGSRPGRWGTQGAGTPSW